MDKEEFNKLEIEDQVKKFNELYEKCNSIRGVCKLLDIGKTTIRERFKKHGYTFQGNGYIKDVNIPSKDNTSLVEPVDTNKQQSNSNIIDMSELENIIENKVSKLLEKYFNNTDSSNIEISSKCDGDVKYGTYGVYKTIAEEFDRYVKNNPRYTKIELTSQAFLEYMLRHK